MGFETVTSRKDWAVVTGEWASVEKQRGMHAILLYRQVRDKLVWEKERSEPKIIYE